jgi:hypothetical protein
MSGISSLIYGSGGGGSGGAKLPSNLLHFSGTIRNDAVNWSAGATLVTVWTPSVASISISTDTQISGGLYATATGLKFTDGTNTVEYACTWSIGDVLTIVLNTTVAGKMKLGMLIEQVVSLLSDHYLNTNNYTNLENYI